MEKLFVGTLLLSVLAGVMTQADMTGKVFIFPQESATAHVSLMPLVRKPLHNFTLCLKAFTDHICPYSLFSYSTPSRDNGLLLFVNKMGEYILTIGNLDVTFKAPVTPYIPVHVCVSWESASGIAEFWVNGKPCGRKGLRKGYSVGAQAKIILGQEQDSFGGRFEAKQSFVGEIWEVLLWDHVLPLTEMCEWCYSGNILNWQALSNEESSYVVTKPKLWV
ncbi:mucosal pentraxin-like [Perognathus longimembris pacificus]|uniref:mucosal pentraxin-like n=1 Tax=Perognathus longimembris pacificus TaxID=214514 RepID=UPI002018AB48|nr:mucosal pentraxin-like [Perognathus longimembris pacificus]